MTDRVVGLLLAAGAGRRAGGPKALRRDPDGTSWLVRAIGVLRHGGCAEVAVVLGSGAAAARAILAAHPWEDGPSPTVLQADDWADGMGASLRAGLLALDRTSAPAVVVHLVDLPDVTGAVVRRLVTPVPGPDTLARAVYAGRPGHPVVIGRAHLRAVAAGLSGDQGARDYLDTHGAYGVECGDLATGDDQDR